MRTSNKRQRTGSLPITAFFTRTERSVPENETIETIDGENEVVVVSTVHKERPLWRVNRAHIVHMLQRRQLGYGHVGRTIGSNSAKSRKQLLEQRLYRFALTHFQRLPVTLQLTDDTVRLLHTHQAIAHCGEFYASCLAFDSQGVLLVAGASNGLIALYDFDEVFHHSINTSEVSDHINSFKQTE